MHPFTLSGLTANDVRGKDREQYLQLTALFEAELRPEGAFEVLHAAEILRAAWRLQRYALLEETADSDVARTSLDRARSHANALIRKNTAELRRRQTERRVQGELGLHLPGMVSLKDYFDLKAHKAANLARPPEGKNEPTPVAPVAPNPTQVAQMEHRILTAITKEEQEQLDALPATPEMKKRTQSQPRNEPCACGSGQKYKRCCGHWTRAA